MRFEHHVVVGVVGDRAARGHGGEAGAAPGAQRAVDDVAVQVRGTPSAPGRESAGEHRQQRAPPFAGEVPVGVCAAHRGEQCLLAPVLGRDHRHRLLREHVQRMGGHVQTVQLAAPHRVEDRGAFDELVPGQREQPGLRRAADRVAGAPGPLQEGRDRARRAELADEVHVADVDPQLQGGGGHQHLEIPGLEPLLGREPALAREAAVMGGHVLLPQRFGERPRHPLRHAAGVDEQQRGAMRLDERAQPPVDLAPDLAGHHRFEGGFGQLQREIALAAVAGVDDGALARPARLVAAGEEVGDGPDRALGRGQADAGEGPSGQRVQALQREREMRAALVAGDGVDLVHDRGLRAREHGPPALAGEEDVERFRRRHQDVRRLPAHGLARRARGVAGAHHGADAGAGLPGLGKGAVDARERHFQVLVHVVAERLERRDVDHPGRVGQRRPAAVPDQGVDGGEEPGQGLARAGGGGDEGVAARRHRVPGLGLAGGGGAEGRLEPGGDGGMEAVEGHEVGAGAKDWKRSRVGSCNRPDVSASGVLRRSAVPGVRRRRVVAGDGFSIRTSGIDDVSVNVNASVFSVFPAP